MSYQIRQTTRKDLPAILDLVRELAVFEKEEAALTATLEDYQHNFDQGTFKSIVAERDGKIAGMMVYYYGFSTWKGKMLFLEDFVVTQSHRRTGIGKLLFDTLIEEAKSQDVRRIKWQVLDWNELALNFYRKYKPEIDGGWLNANLYLPA